MKEHSRRPYKTAILLFMVLVLPLLVYVFLRTGQNTYQDLPIYGPVDVVERVEDGKVLVDTVQHRIPAFDLQDQLNRRVRDEDLSGTVYVADFIFTRCPTICPTMTTQMARVQKRFQDQQDVKLISFSIDPVHDSVPILHAYTQKFEADPNQWHFLTGSKKEIYKLAREGFMVTAQSGDGGVQDFIHSDKMVLVDHKGHIRGYYTGTEKESMDRLMEDIQTLRVLHKRRQKSSGA